MGIVDDIVNAGQPILDLVEDYWWVLFCIPLVIGIFFLAKKWGLI